MALGARLKVAVTDLLAVRFMEQSPRPEQSIPHPPNRDIWFGVAYRMTVVLGSSALHVPLVQDMPPESLVTVPVPFPSRVAENVYG